jgi:hypothetical protein
VAHKAIPAQGSLRKTLNPIGSFTAARMAHPAAAIAATVSGPTDLLVKGTSPKFSMNKASAPPRS